MTDTWIYMFEEIFIIIAVVVLGGLFLIGAVMWIIESIRDWIWRRSHRK